MVTRRRFVRGVGLALLAAAGQAGAGAEDARAQAAGASLEGPLSRDVFRALVREEFSVLLANQPATLVLVRVDDDPRSPDGRQFVAVFEGPPDLKLEENSYRVTHATAGTTLLYLRPRGRDGRHSYYDAPFNVVPGSPDINPPVRELKRYERPLYEPPRR